MYTAFVRPHLEGAQSTWTPNLKRHIDALEKVQIRATQLVDGLGKLDYPERLKQLNLPFLRYRRMRGDMIEIYKHFHTYDKEIISPSFQPNTRPSRKHNFQLHHRRPKDGTRGLETNGFYNRCINTWNNLPREVTNAENINIFKNRLDKAWSDILFKFDHNA